MKEVLTFSIDIIDICEVKGASAVAAMILFTGTADCKNFQGRILPGGVDTQKEWYGSARTLSARYILEGIDCGGQACRIFVENNGTVGTDIELKITPKIITDSKALAWMEKAHLSGTVVPKEGGVIIHIFDE